MHITNHVLSQYLRAQMPAKQWIDLELAYKMSRLLVTMIVAPARINHGTMELDGEAFAPGDYQLVKSMVQAFHKDPSARALLTASQGPQTFHRDTFIINFEGMEFDMPGQATYHIWNAKAAWGCQIKATSATSLEKFVQLAGQYDYDRERAWCMDVVGADQDILIGISKKAPKVFILPIKRGDPIHTAGQKKYQQLAFLLHRDQNIN